MRLDLHIHTVASDGAWTPEEVVEGAVRGRLDVIAVADHDTTAAVEPAQEAASGRNLQVIPAAELSSTHDGKELHILGYFLDPSDPALRAYERTAERRRLERMEAIVRGLAPQGVEVSMEAVLREAGPRRTTVGRPHLARVLVEEGYVDDVPEAFDRYIGDEHPAFVPTDLGDPAAAIEVIVGAGGIPVWAHPPSWLVDELLPGLVRAGLRGLEVYRPRWRPDQIRRMEEVARSAGLLRSGGSDFHDPARDDPLGDFWVTADDVAGLLEAGGL